MTGYNRRTCPSCGKIFYYDIFCDWAYKLRAGEKSPKNGQTPVRYYCSWTCMRQAEKEKDAQRKLKRAWVDVDPEEWT